MRVFVIGQSPRPELEAEIEAAVPGLNYTLQGALDGMTREEIARDAAPRSDADTLFTVLPSGESTTISKAVVTERLKAMLEAQPGAALLCCTGAFKGLPERADLVKPADVLNGLAESLLPKGKLGVFVPLPEQVETLGAKRAREGLEVVVHPLRPLSSAEEVRAAAKAMAAEKPDLVLLDCMSYTAADKAIIGRELASPILLSIAVAARTAANLLPE
ncbi:AroM family protein [Acetobacteraceae bacterium H6797]|nr:AroM family protein [Acetobacteraceae bacterium H6797]